MGGVILGTVTVLLNWTLNLSWQHQAHYRGQYKLRAVQASMEDRRHLLGNAIMFPAYSISVLGEAVWYTVRNNNLY